MANIAFILHSFPEGGVERVIMNLAKPLTACGHRIFMFVHILHEERLENEELPITYIKIPYKVKKSGNYPVVLEAVKQHDIKVLFTLSQYPKYLAELKATGLCCIVHVLHGTPFYEKAQKFGKITQPQKFSIGFWLKKHLLYIPKYKLGYYDWKLARKYKKVYNNSDAYGVLFDGYGKQIAKALNIDYETSHLYTLQNPIPEVKYDGAATRQKRIIYVGRLTYWDKRLDRLLAVWEKLHLKFPDWELCFVGDGADEGNLRKIVAEKSLQRVHFLGWHNNPSEFFKTSEIMCMTSIVEGCPMALLEAQQCGCATIAFNCSAGIEEMLSPNWESGVYVPNGDIDAYADALSRLMSDEALRRKIQSNGPINVKRFSVEKSVEQYDALIKKLTNK